MMEASFFRSLSLVEDLAHPPRFAHYRPTRRALPIITAITRPSAVTMVIAPYGSGKSLAAGVGALLVRGEPGDCEALSPVLDRLAQVDPAASADYRAYCGRNGPGKLVILTGLVDDPLAAISASLGMSNPPKTVEGFGKAMRDGGWDHVAIIWDEFGRHLEGLVADGRASELDVVQRLAERVARASEPSMSLTLLLHQNLLAYATRLNETSRSEWRKIEGRFDPLRMVEDSQEFYRLVADVVRDMRPAAVDAAFAVADDETVDAALRWKWLDGIETRERMRAILDDARPLSPGALQILPTLVARVGQNERSLFSFLREADLARPVDIEAIYSAFSDAMRTDVGIGGTYRRWIETESARSRADDDLQRAILAGACLLQLGTSGERRRLPRDLLELALAGSAPRTAISEAVNALLAANLLLWRRHTDDVAVWHGADIDVAIRVREERERRGAAFALRPFLEERFPAPHLRATRHNAEFGVNRFLGGRYVALDELTALVEDPAAIEGQLLYVLADDKAAIKLARKAARKTRARAVIVVPDRPLAAESAALELTSIEALRADKEFLESDPMVVTEIDELQSVAFEELAAQLRTLLDPRGGSASWYAEGEQLGVSAERPASMAASRLLGRWFHQTPRIANEQLMRDAASRTMQTARVRIVGAILERGDRPRLGYEEGDRSAEGSIYRTVFEHSGLRPAGATRFADPDELADPGLREVWMRIAEFFRQPSGMHGYKDLGAFVAGLAAVPIGAPRAVIPLLVAAGFKHFARAVALYKDGIYIADTLGFQFDGMVANPEGFTVQVLDVTPERKEYLSEIAYVFAHEHPSPADELVRFAHDAILRWLLTVPDGSRRSQKLSARGKSLLRALGAMGDPVDLLFRALPEAMGGKKALLENIAALEGARNDVDHMRDQFAVEAVDVIRESFRSNIPVTDPLAAVTAWANCFDMSAIERRGDLRIIDKAVLRKSVEAINGRFSPKSLANNLSSILLQRSLDKWDDRTAAEFRFALRDARERIESAALDTDRPDEALRPIIEARLAGLAAMLQRLDEADDEADGEAGLRVAGGNI